MISNKLKNEISMDSLLIISVRTFLRSLPMIFEDDLPYWNTPKENNIENEIDNLFNNFKNGLSGMIGSDLALFEIFHTLQYSYSYVFRVEYATKVDMGITWKIYSQSDSYSDFIDSKDNSRYLDITSAYHLLIKASLEITVAFHTYHKIIDDLRDNPTSNYLTGVPSMSGNKLIAHKEIKVLMLSAKSSLYVVLERLLIASRNYEVEDFFKKNIMADFDFLSEKHLRGYDKNSFFNNKYAIELASSPIFKEPTSLFTDKINNFYSYMNKNESKFYVWFEWYKCRVKGIPINPDLVKTLTDIPERLNDKPVQEKHKYLKKMTERYFKESIILAEPDIEKTYQVAVSFAGEDREYVDEFCNILKELEIKIFYDDFEKDNLWGKNLYQHFSEVFKNQCDFCVIFISKFYANKAWTKHELVSAQARAFRENREYILPVRFDDTNLPGLEEITGYLDANVLTPRALAELTLSKINNLNKPK